jgi:hypothetical protein
MLLSSGSVLCLQPDCFEMMAPLDEEEQDAEGGFGDEFAYGTVAPIPFASAGARHHQHHTHTHGHNPHQAGFGSGAGGGGGGGGGGQPTSKFKAAFPHSNKLPRGAGGATGRGILGRGNSMLSNADSTHSSASAAAAAGGGGGGNGSGVARHRKLSESTVDTSASGNTLHSFATFNSVDTKIHKKADIYVPCYIPPNIPGSAYNLRMVFETHTTYLAVPYTTFDKILDDSKRILPKISKGMLVCVE